MPPFITRRRARRASLVAGVLSLAVLGAACLPPPAPPAQTFTVGPVNDIIARQNNARTGAGLAGFLGDGGMNSRAQYHANRLASSAGGTCKLWHSSELGTWYAGQSAGENVACFSPCPANGAAVVNLWLNSAGHRVNIMNPGYRFIGAGATCDGGRLFAVSHYRTG